MSRLSSVRPSIRPPGRAGYRSAFAWRPDPCLLLELQECFYGRSVRVRWHNLPGLAGLGDEAMTEIDSQVIGKALDPVFFDDVEDVIWHWLAYHAGFRPAEVRAAFRISIFPHDRLIEVVPVSSCRDLPFILISLRDRGVSLRPTLH